MNRAIADIAHVDSGGVAFHNQIAVKFLGTKRAAGGTQGHAGVSGDQHFVVNSSAGGVSPGQQMRDDRNMVAPVVPVNFHFVGVENSVYYHMVSTGRLD